MDHENSNVMNPDETPELKALYEGFEKESILPLWTQVGDLMPVHPKSKAVPHVWKWSNLNALAEKSGELIPVGRGGERRALGLANPGLYPNAYISPTLWAAIQHLGPRETAPEHRHSQNAFRFVVEGNGVWTVVNGDPVRMSRGDLLLTPGWCYYATPNYSRAERLWGHPGLRPLSGLQDTVNSPMAAYRWEHTDRALAEQLLLEDEGHPATHEQGHAAIRYTNPTTGGDVMPTIRLEFHRLRAGVETPMRREVGSTVFQVFEGTGAVVLDGVTHKLDKGDMFVIPSWIPWSLQSETQFDLFRFSDAPIMERLGFMRTMVEGA